MTRINHDLYDWNYAARPERAEALSPGQRPGLLCSQTCRPVRAKALKIKAIHKAFALTGRTAFIPRALPWAKSFCPFRAFQPYRSINLKFVFVYLLAEIETNADAIIVFGDFADSTESGVAAQGSQRLDDGKQFLRLEENADARCVLGGETIEAE